MKSASGVVLRWSLALALQTTLARLLVRGTARCDLVLVVVVYVALTMGPATGMLAGTVAGLAQDALSSGVIGIGGLAKTVVGFLAGVVGTQFIVARRAAAVRGVRRRDRGARGDVHGHCTCCSGCGTSGRRRRRRSARRSVNALVGVVAFQADRAAAGRRRAPRAVRRSGETVSPRSECGTI